MINWGIYQLMFTMGKTTFVTIIAISQFGVCLTQLGFVFKWVGFTIIWLVLDLLWAVALSFCVLDTDIGGQTH
jgi:hypothetical protein